MSMAENTPKPRVEVVIPVGVGDFSQDIPKLDLLRKGLLSVKEQSVPVRLTVAMDVNLPRAKIDVVRELADRVVEFPSHSYFRRGGIWNKIYTCWESSDCDYVAWNGYDDMHTRDRFEAQSKKLDETGAASCFCPNYEMHDGVGQKKIHNGNIDFKSHIGSHAPFMGAFLLRREAIINSGIGTLRDKWVLYFEGLLYAYIMKMGLPVVSDGPAGFIYHWHRGTIGNTGNEEKPWVIQARQETKYDLDATKHDWLDVKFESLCAEVRRQH
jgi:hypothetical protein